MSADEANDVPSRVVFAARQAVITTRHAKERVIAPVLGALGLDLLVDRETDTDLMGTFTREVARAGTQLEAACAKARAGLALHPEASFGIGSEGSFGPHPMMPWVAVGLEIVVLVDREGSLELVGRDLALETNFDHIRVSNIDEAMRFAVRVGFPEQGLVVMRDPNDGSAAKKGLKDEETFRRTIAEALGAHGQAHVETDMRAHVNPKRMESIRRAAVDLRRVMQSECPRCAWPGFVASEIERGRPCENCGHPTQLPRAEVSRCRRCGHHHREALPEAFEDAPIERCDICNP